MVNFAACGPALGSFFGARWIPAAVISMASTDCSVPMTSASRP